jgi:hypothetical protein
MPNPTLCEQVCTDLGWIGQLLALALIAGRALWLSYRNKQSITAHEKKADQLEKKIEQLSLRPPQMPVTPIAVQLGPEQIEGLAQSLRPSLQSAWLKASEPAELDPDGPTEPPPRAK